MKKILLALIVLVYQGQNKATLPALSISSTPINRMIATLIAFGSGYKTATTIIDYTKKNNAPVTPYLLKALSAGLIGVGGLVFLGKESGYSEHALYVSTFALGCFMGTHSSIIQHDLDTAQHDLNTTKLEHLTTQRELATTQHNLSNTQDKLSATQHKLSATQKELDNLKASLRT